jgi:hypothetical protein
MVYALGEGGPVGGHGFDGEAANVAAALVPAAVVGGEIADEAANSPVSFLFVWRKDTETRSDPSYSRLVRIKTSQTTHRPDGVEAAPGAAHAAVPCCRWLRQSTRDGCVAAPLSLSSLFSWWWMAGPKLKPGGRGMLPFRSISLAAVVSRRVAVWCVIVCVDGV